MSFVGNENVAEATVVHVQDNQLLVNTLYFFSTVPITEANLYALASGLGDIWENTFMPLKSSTVFLSEVNVIQLVPVPAPTAAWSPLTVVQGGDTNAASPNNVSLAISFRTGLSGRSYRGRNYWIGFTEPNVTNNQIDGTLVNSILAAYTLLIGVDAVASDWTWSVYSRYVNGVERETGTSTDVTSVGTTDSIVDSQRRRLPGRGR